MTHDPWEERLAALRRGAPFSMPDPSVVRRRGDRLRRRRAAVTAGGTTLALALAAGSVLWPARSPQPGPPRPTDGGLTLADTLSPSDLPQRPELRAWRELPERGPALACVSGRVVDSLGAPQSASRSYGATLRDSSGRGPTAARVHETVLAFADVAGASAALSTLRDRLRAHCAAPDLANRRPLESRVVRSPGTGVWELYVRRADRVCTGCDAAYFDRQAAVRIGDRVVMLSFGELGGPLQPDGLEASMRSLVTTAVALAAQGAKVTGG